MGSIEERARNFVSILRHCQVLGITVEQADKSGLLLKLPFSDKIVGNPITGVVHGGAITTLMDSCCGISTVCFLPDFEICPTLDLRIDYMRPAEPGLDIYGFAECYRVTSTVIFTRGVAYQTSLDKPVAHVVGTFMRMGKPDAKGQVAGLARAIDGGEA